MKRVICVFGLALATALAAGCPTEETPDDTTQDAVDATDEDDGGTGEDTSDDSDTSDTGTDAADGTDDAATDADEGDARDARDALVIDSGDDVDETTDAADDASRDGGGDDGTSMDTSDAPSADFVTRTGSGECPDDPAAEILVGAGGSNTYATASGTGANGTAQVLTGEWVNFDWSEAAGPHTVTGDESTEFASNPEQACMTDNTAWFDSGQQTSGVWCVQFNRTGRFYYQCTVAGHCEAGMVGWVEVSAP